MTEEKKLGLDDLLAMDNAALRRIVMKGHAIDPAALEDTMYLGVDLSLPKIANMLLWKTFRKTFHKDPELDHLRGWNVRMEQTGWDGPCVPKKDSKGKRISFGHYRLLPAEGKKFPSNWSGPQYLDYTVAGNFRHDPAGLGYCPLVAVNEGDNDLLLGWEVFKLGPVFVPLPDFWALRKEGPLDEVVPIPSP